MLSLYRSGRQAEALEAYQEGRSVLVEGLGIEPGRRLRDLHQAILQQDRELDLRADEPATAPPRGAFIGREPELAALVGGLDDACAGHGRLFLLVGQPGIGKSRLAEELIGQAQTQGRGSSWAAAGRRAAHPPTGPGRNRCAPTSARRSLKRCALSSGPPPPISPRSSRS